MFKRFVIFLMGFTLVFSLFAVNVNAVTMLKPTDTQEGLKNGQRVKYPSKNNPFFFSSKYNTFVNTPYGPPSKDRNCTWYAYGRFGEIMGGKPILGAQTKGSPNRATGNAYSWYRDTTVYQKGKTPKVGAIVCWSYPSSGGSPGHVAVVEKVDENGDILISQSGWSSSINFWTDVWTKKSGYTARKGGGSSGWKLEGFIYQPKDVTLSGTNNNSNNGAKNINKVGVITEDDLTGMPNKVDFGDGAGEINLAGSDSLSEIEKRSLVAIGDDIKANKSEKYNIVFTTISFLGLFVILYGIFLGLAYMFDRTNNLFDISLLGLITLGRYRLWEEDYGLQPGYCKADKKLYCNGGVLIKKIIVIELIGFLLVSGVIFDVMYDLVIKVGEWL